VSPAEIRVSVAYAERDRQTVIELTVPAGTTAAEAIERAAIHACHPGIPAGAPLGVYGRLVPPTAVLADGDRVELYRGLPADPKEQRRRLAREGRTMGRRR
jgi:putative ubiquitin-RnfH superfamily antitoxin RatB of RatAB toxin-antitoxin module